MKTALDSESAYLICFAVNSEPAAGVTFLGPWQKVMTHLKPIPPGTNRVVILTLAVPAELRAGDELLTEFVELAEYLISEQEPVYFKKSRLLPSRAETIELQRMAHLALAKAC